MHILGMDKLIIIQNEDKRLALCSQTVDQLDQRRLERDLQSLCETFKLLANPFHDTIQGGDQIAYKTNRIVIPIINRKPGYGKLGVGCPAGQERRFPETSRSG